MPLFRLVVTEGYNHIPTSFRAAIAPLVEEAVLTAWTISWGVLFARLANSPAPLTRISRPSLEGGAVMGTAAGSAAAAATVAQVGLGCSGCSEYC